MPAANWETRHLNTHLTGNWAPSGHGTVEFRPSLVAPVEMMFRDLRYPITGTNGSVALVLSRAPKNHASAYLGFQMAADHSGMRWTCFDSHVQLQSVSAAGAVTNVGLQFPLARKLANGDVLETRWTATTATLFRNAVQVAQTSYTPLAGQNVGFGGFHPLFVALIGHIAAEFAGIAWHP
jgi:hypothetical protein